MLAVMPDALSHRYEDLLAGRYDCVDRIVLNADHRLAHSAAGFRVWWRRLTGSDETLDHAHLMRLAGRFSRRVRGYAKAHQIPVIDCRVKERKHEMAEEDLKTTTVTQGVFLILVGRAQARVWDVGRHHHIEPKEPMPYVNHYSFHILDEEWGHVTIKISGHPPFPAQVMLNGHEYVACQARKAGIHFRKEGNCFTEIADAACLATIAETLAEESAIGRLRHVCDRWLYSTCLCVGLDLEDQQRRGFCYQYSTFQIEYSRNLLFAIGGQMEEVFQALMDRRRAPLDLKTIKTILGDKHRPKYRTRKGKSAQWEVAVERPPYDLTIFKLHCGRLTLKIYTKGERVLRAEAVAHDTGELDCGRSLERLPAIVTALQGMLGRFLDAVHCVDRCFISDETLDQLPAPSHVGRIKVGGIDFNTARMRRVTAAVLALSTAPGGFTASQVAARVQALSGDDQSAYHSRHAAYDLKKLRGKGLVQRGDKTPRYEATSTGLRTLTALLVLRDNVIQPRLAAARDPRPSLGAQNPTAIDGHYGTIRSGMLGLFQELGVTA
jgi:hypothetical protein